MTHYKTIAIMVPMPSEFEHYGITGQPDRTIAGHQFHRTTINGVQCIIGQSGIGKVNMATATTLMMENYSPDLLINAGVGGAVDTALDAGDVVISQSLVDADYGRRADGKMIVCRANTDPFADGGGDVGLPVLQSIKDTITPHMEDIPYSVQWGVIATGDVFVNCAEHLAWLRNNLNATVTAMEGIAMAQIAEKYNVPALEIRAVSDKADGNSMGDFETNLKLAATNASHMCKCVVKWLGTPA